jgi:hypothetical protein
MDAVILYVSTKFYKDSPRFTLSIIVIFSLSARCDKVPNSAPECQSFGVFKSNMFSL